jgi:hypothetical protein
VPKLFSQRCEPILDYSDLVREILHCIHNRCSLVEQLSKHGVVKFEAVKSGTGQCSFFFVFSIGCQGHCFNHVAAQLIY